MTDKDNSYLHRQPDLHQRRAVSSCDISHQSDLNDESQNTKYIRRISKIDETDCVSILNSRPETRILWLVLVFR